MDKNYEKELTDRFNQVLLNQIFIAKGITAFVNELLRSEDVIPTGAKLTQQGIIDISKEFKKPDFTAFFPDLIIKNVLKNNENLLNMIIGCVYLFNPSEKTKVKELDKIINETCIKSSDVNPKKQRTMNIENINKAILVIGKQLKELFQDGLHKTIFIDSNKLKRENNSSRKALENTNILVKEIENVVDSFKDKEIDE